MKKNTIAIVLAAGRGKRMQSQTAKQYLLIQDKPVLYYSLKAFQDSRIDQIVLVTGADEIRYVREEIVEKYGFTKVAAIVEGGKERYHSVHKGLQAAAELQRTEHLQAAVEFQAAAQLQDAEETYVFIHDGARPFVNEEIIERAYECVIGEKACVAGMPVKDTIKIADSEGYAAQTPNRSLVWMIQTPQVFELQLIKDAYQELVDREEEILAKGIQVTDDAFVAELLTDRKVKLIEGSYQNIKITTPEDLLIAEAYLKE